MNENLQKYTNSWIYQKLTAEKANICCERDILRSLNF